LLSMSATSAWTIGAMWWVREEKEEKGGGGRTRWRGKRISSQSCTSRGRCSRLR
jgi:hypothetical protein